MEQGVEFQGRMLRIARQARQLTQQQLASATGITQPFISLIEDCERTPSNEQLERFVAVLEFKRRFFFQDFPITGPGVGEVYHRRKKMSPKALDSYYAWANIKMMAVQKMLVAVEWPEVSLPNLSVGIDAGTEEEAAALVRAKFHVPRGPIASVSAILDQAGVMVIPEYSSHAEMDGTSVWRTDLPPMIFVNQHAPQDRLRFTMLHETGHLVLHQRSVLSQLSDGIEEQAHRFASAFLMPAEEIRPQLRNLTISKLADLKRHWRVAMSALVMRAKQLEVITPTTATELWRELSKRGWMKREPEQLDIRGETPGRLFLELINLHLTDLGYSEQRFEELLNLSHEDVYSQIMPQSMMPKLRIVEPLNRT